MNCFGSRKKNSYTINDEDGAVRKDTKTKDDKKKKEDEDVKKSENIDENIKETNGTGESNNDAIDESSKVETAVDSSEKDKKKDKKSKKNEEIKKKKKEKEEKEKEKKQKKKENGSAENLDKKKKDKKTKNEKNKATDKNEEINGRGEGEGAASVEEEVEKSQSVPEVALVPGSVSFESVNGEAEPVEIDSVIADEQCGNQSKTEVVEPEPTDILDSAIEHCTLRATTAITTTTTDENDSLDDAERHDDVTDDVTDDVGSDEKLPKAIEAEIPESLHRNSLSNGRQEDSGSNSETGDSSTAVLHVSPEEEEQRITSELSESLIREDDDDPFEE